MNQILVIGSGISGLVAAITCADLGTHVILAAPYPSERSQSVMAAGGINGALDHKGEHDSADIHAADTIKGGNDIANRQAVHEMCEAAPGIIEWLEKLGTEFARTKTGEIDQRAFGGQSKRRTAYCGASTGKQIVTALTRKCRKLEAEGKVERRLNQFFLDLILDEEQCTGAVLWDKRSQLVYAQQADAVILATGGQNRLFGKTTGSMLCDGSAAAQAFKRGAALKNLEMIQYHPTTIETPQKRMLISEAARGEGGRLFYLSQGTRVYFMEDKYGPRGNLMPRDVVSREIFSAPGQVYLDITFLGKDVILKRLSEIYDLCLLYIGLDVTKEPIPVSPSVHFFMGGLAVNREHETTIPNLFAVGECACMYHGANRLGGNSLLAACYSGMTAAKSAVQRKCCGTHDTDATVVAACENRMRALMSSQSKFPCQYLLNQVADIMNHDLGIVRTGLQLQNGISDIDFLLGVVKKLKFDPFDDTYRAYMAENQLILAKVILMSALGRQESRGSHFRSDFPESREEFRKASIVYWNGGNPRVSFVDEGEAR